MDISPTIPASRTCVCLGGGPTAKRFLPLALDAAGQNPVVITCNAGLRLIPVPDFYIVTDGCAVEDYKDDYTMAQRAGTKILTHPSAAGQIDCPTSLIDYDFHNVTNYKPGVFTHGRSSGVLALNVAIREGATDIHMLGYDGFGPSEMVYTRKNETHQRHGINEAMSIVIGKMIAMHPEITFHWWGALASRLCFPDWRVHYSR